MKLTVGKIEISLENPVVMAIVNVTPDSFFSGSRTQEADAIDRRVRQAAIFTIEAAFCMLVVLVGLCWVNGDALIRLFRDDPAVTAVALPAFHYQCLAMLLHPIIVVANMTFQSVGASGRATFLACCRQGVFFIPLILILPRTHGLFGVEICQPIADVLTFLVSLPFLIAFLQQLGRMDDAEQSKTAS